MVRIFAVSIALVLAASGAAWACQAKTTNAILDDTFKTPDPGWGAPDEQAEFTAAGLVLKPPVNGSAWRWNPNYTIDGNSLCASVINPGSAGRDIGDVGVWFWSQNGQNFYTATLALDGTASIDRLVNGVWHNVLPPTPSGAIHTKPGAVNEIEVTVHGNTGTFFINGAKIVDFRGDAPPKGGPPGVYAESGSNAVTWVFPRVQLF